MVGRLVHQQHVRPSQQHARQRHAHLPAARQRAHVAIDLVVLKAQPVQHLARLRLQRVAAQMLVLFLHVAEAFQDPVHLVRPLGIFHGALQSFQLVMQIARAAAARDGFIQHRPALHLLHVLAEIADVQPLRNRDCRLRRAPLRPRSCGKASSCPRRSGPTRPTFSPGFN